MIDYVLGFVFTPDQSQVALIRKNHPNWQAGDLNGVGGVVMQEESYEQAMIREWQEETGLQHDGCKFNCIAEIVGAGYSLSVFAATLNVMPADKFKVAGEQVSWYGIYPAMCRDDLVKDVKWLIQLALEEPENPVKVTT